VYDAVGIRLCDLPITAEKVYRALQTPQGTGAEMATPDGRSQ
jgi:hypothetical protein